MYKRNKNLKRLGMTVVISIIALTFAAQASAAYDPEISVCAPDWTITPFDATIRMEYFDGGVRSLEGQFDLSFDTDVVELKSVTGKEIGGKEVTIEWEFVDGSDNSKIHVEFTVPDDVNSMLTNGNIAKVHFDLVGDRGDSSLLDISGGSLAYKDGTPVSADVFAKFSQLPCHTMRKLNRQGHKFGCFIGCEPDHHTLVAGAGCIHTHGDIRRLTVYRGKYRTGLVIKSQVSMDISDILDYAANQLWNIHIGFGRDLTTHQRHSGGEKGFTGYTTERIVSHYGIEYGI